jgi:uncharacterized protein (TIGR02145 family)
MRQTSTTLLAILAVAMICFNGCNKSSDPVSSGGSAEQGYIRIGTQVWTTVNLNVDHYRNGDSIPQVKDSIEWSNMTTGAWCYYHNDTAYGRIYGKLYNWYAVTDSRGLAPAGWHIPSDSEWTTLTDFLGDQAGGKMKATILWSYPNTGATNSSGFTGLPGSSRFSDGRYAYIGEFGNFWSASEFNPNNAWFRDLDYGNAYVFRGVNFKKNGYSVRSVRDN